MPVDPARRSIVQLLQVPQDQHDADWLIQALQWAVELELSTLPPYLCGYWSIPQDSGAEVAGLIRSVIMQEMLHLGLACNMLTTVGGVPQMNASVPTYPGPLPGGVRPELTVHLQGLTKEYVNDVYMQIEYPEGGPIAAEAETFETIGAFYDAILAVFQTNPPPMTGQHQISGPLGLFPIETAADAERAITEIKEQGEGTSQSPDDAADELAHYYKFAEIYNGHELVYDQATGTWGYTGTAIPFPAALPMAPVPAGGWSDPVPAAQAPLQQFRTAFKTILDNLQTAWTTDPDAIQTAIVAMFDLAGPAQALMAIPLPDGSGNYGPDFQFPAT